MWNVSGHYHVFILIVVDNPEFIPSSQDSIFQLDPVDPGG
jgi:hypothetical protein